MKFYLILVVYFFSISLNAQKKWTYYLMGRPMSIERNNAFITVGIEHDINFEYACNDDIEIHGIEYFVNYNDSISKLIADNKLGDNWLNDLYVETDLEEVRQNNVREIVKGTKYFETYSVDLFEPIILLKKRKAKKNEKYLVYVVGQLKEDETRKFNTHLIFKYNKKKKKIILKSHKVKPLPFVLPQNGVI